MVPNGDVICHGDTSPCNFVFKNDYPTALIDFDAAFIGSRQIDIGYAAWLWTDLGSLDQENVYVAKKLSAFCIGYDRISRKAVLDAINLAQDWLLQKMIFENEKHDMGTAIEWVKHCQVWFTENRSEVFRHMH